MQSVETGTATWYVRPFRPGDEEQLAALYAEVLGRERALAAWRWKLMERELSPASVWVAVTREGRIVGQYGGIPLRVRLRGGDRPAVNTVEAMTAPDFRRQGIITRLGEAAHEGWAKAGYAAALALPNEQWGTRTHALGFRRVLPLAWLRFPLHAERVITRRGHLPAPLSRPAAAIARVGSAIWRLAFQSLMRGRAGGSSVRVEEAAGRDVFDRLWSHLACEYENVVVRDGDWVDWRFRQSAAYAYKVLVAHREGKPCGYIAYRLADTGERANGYIADIFLGRDDPATASALMMRALYDLSARGAGMVLATAAPGSPLYRQLRRLGFLPARRWTAFNFEIAPLQPGVDLTNLLDPRTWHITAGDFDVI